MSTSKHIDLIGLLSALLAFVVTFVCVFFHKSGSVGVSMKYENTLFRTDTVHTIDIVIDDWDGFIESCESEEYSICDVVIDGQSFQNIGIRAKVTLPFPLSVPWILSVTASNWNLTIM